MSKHLVENVGWTVFIVLQLYIPASLLLSDTKTQKIHPFSLVSFIPSSWYSALRKQILKTLSFKKSGLSSPPSGEFSGSFHIDNF